MPDASEGELEDHVRARRRNVDFLRTLLTSPYSLGRMAGFSSEAGIADGLEKRAIHTEEETAAKSKTEAVPLPFRS